MEKKPRKAKLDVTLNCIRTDERKTVCCGTIRLVDVNGFRRAIRMCKPLRKVRITISLAGLFRKTIVRHQFEWVCVCFHISGRKKQRKKKNADGTVLLPRPLRCRWQAFWSFFLFAYEFLFELSIDYLLLRPRSSEINSSHKTYTTKRTNFRVTAMSLFQSRIVVRLPMFMSWAITWSILRNLCVFPMWYAVRNF